MPLKVFPIILPKAGSVNIKFEGYLQRMHVGTYVVLDNNCQNPTIAYISDSVKSENDSLFQKLDGRVPVNERFIAHGIFVGKLKRSSSIKEKSGNNWQVYIDVSEIKIRNVVKISEQFNSKSQCSMMY